MPRASALASHAYDRLRDAIIRGDVRPGEALFETQLADELGMSRTPVREALKVLARDGFVDIVPARGYFVPQHSIDDLRELFELRETLEGMAARYAALRAGEDELQALERLCLRYERAKDLATWTRAGTEFHTAIVAACRNERLARILDSLKAQIVLTRHSALRSAQSRRDETIGEHRAILREIKRRDADAAEQHARSHVRRSYGAIIRSLQPAGEGGRHETP